MNKNWIILSLLLIFSCPISFGQVEYMINGGLESWDDDDNPADGVPDDWYDHSIEYGVGWHNLTNTSDIVHPNYPFISGTPHTGDGCGRFGAPTNGSSEFCYGTTNALTAGEIYQVSFWIRKDYSTTADRQIGLTISETVPTIQLSPVFIASHQPIIEYTPTSTQYVKLTACFTAQTTGTHYVSIGPYGGTGTPESILYNFDDVSVMSLAPGTILPMANLAIPQTSFCTNDNVTVDGGFSTDETSYEWKVYKLIGGNPGALEYSSGILNGQAATLDVGNAIGFYQAGDCYRVVLKVYGVCEDETYVDFCYVNPDFDFSYDSSPICEGTPITISASANSGWFYSWSNGQSGVNFNSITVTPTVTSSTYSLTITTPENCVRTEEVTLEVHSLNNVAPWMNGINGSGDFTIYVNQGDAVNFTSTLFNDTQSENITATATNTIPSGFTATVPNIAGQNLVFGWQTLASTPTGAYTYTLHLEDDNACAFASEDYVYTIVVICDYCPICVTYDNRLPSSNPLPGETNAGDCIRAGFNAPVETGTASVLFRAGNEVELGEFFLGEPGFEAVVDPATCVELCDVCCESFVGFTHDTPLPNVFTPNGDGINDVWYVADTDNPYCAFNAQGFSLVIIDDLGFTVHQSQDYGGCCAFTAPPLGNYSSYSSIFWDGTHYNNGNLQPEGYYFYLVTFFGCGEETQYHGNIFIADPQGKKSLEGNGPLVFPSVDETMERDGIESVDGITLTPNPTKDFVNVQGIGNEEWKLTMIDNQGNRVLTSTVNSGNTKLNVSFLAPGTYYVLMSSGDKSHFDKIVVI